MIQSKLLNTPFRDKPPPPPPRHTYTEVVHILYGTYDPPCVKIVILGGEIIKFKIINKI